MANVSNAFNALLGGGEQAISAKKKKQNNKQQAAAKVQAAEAPANRAASPAAAVEANGARPQNSGVVDASEATAILERAAREAKGIADKCRLWKDWVRQGNDRSGKGIKYKAADGSSLDFKQVLLLSKALDSSIESSLVSGLTHDHQESLASLLTAFLPGANGQALAAQLVRLAGLLVDEAPDTLGAAQRAVRGTVATLKAGTAGGDAGSGAGDAVSSWLSGIDQADKEIRKQEGLLQKLHATSGGVVTKEQLSCARTMFKVCEDKLDLLQPKNLPSAKALSRTECKGLDEFKAVVNSRLKEATKLEESVNTKAASAETQRVQTLAACRREEAIVTQESNEVAGQIRTLEAQLRALRSRQAELEEKRAQLQQRSRMVLDSMGSSRGLGGVLSSSHYREEMAVVKALDELLNPNQGASSEQVEIVQQSQAQAPQEYLSHGQQYLALALASLVEIPTKLNFCKQRLSHADKLAKLTTTGGHSKQKEDAEKLLAEHMKTADDINRSALQAVTDLKQRCQEIGRGSPTFAAAAAQQLHSVDALLSQIREAHEAIQVAYHAPLVEAPPAPVQANGKGGRGQAAANGGAYKGGAGSRPASAAPVPQVAPVAAPGPPPSAAAVTPTASDPVTAAPVPSLSPAAAPVVAPRAPAPPAKQWGRVAAAPAEVDSSLPTPAEAFRAAAAASSSADGFKDVPAKKNRNKREEPQQA